MLPWFELLTPEPWVSDACQEDTIYDLCIIHLQKEYHPIMRQQAACLQGRDRIL